LRAKPYEARTAGGDSAAAPNADFQLQSPRNRAHLLVQLTTTPDGCIQLGDCIVSVDGEKKDMTIRQFQAHLHLNRNWGESTAITLRRSDRDLELTLQFPEQPLS
jgi:hypothetical protein